MENNKEMKVKKKKYIYKKNKNAINQKNIKNNKIDKNKVK